jgi:L-idonate 5-dehydrogenase
MKAVIIHAPEDLRIDSLEEEQPGPGQLQVRVAFGGICGSDLHYYQHGGFGTVRIKEPMALGHEISGVVSALGAGVEGFSIGQRVAISPSRPCFKCRFCQLGQHNQCLDMRFFGSAMRFPHIQGAFREKLVIESHQAHPLRAGVSLALAALAEPLSVGLHAINRAGSVFGKQILVTGSGPIGAMLIAALRRAGAARIVAAMGADETINLASHPEGLAPYAKDKGQFDVMFEASGSDRALRTGLEVVAPRGVIVSVGMGPDASLPMTPLVAKELELRGTFRFHAEFAVAVQFINEGLVDLRPVISHVVGVNDAVAAFKLAGDKKQAMKVQIDFGVEPANL